MQLCGGELAGWVLGNLPESKLKLKGGLLQSHYSLVKQEIGRVRQSQIIRHALKASMDLFLLYTNILEQQCSSTHVDCEFSHFPVALRDLGAPYCELPALLKMSQ